MCRYFNEHFVNIFLTRNQAVERHRQTVGQTEGRTHDMRSQDRDLHCSTSCGKIYEWHFFTARRTHECKTGTECCWCRTDGESFEWRVPHSVVPRKCTIHYSSLPTDHNKFKVINSRRTKLASNNDITVTQEAKLSLG